VKTADIDMVSRVNIQQMQLNLYPRNSGRLTLDHHHTYANAFRMKKTAVAKDDRMLVTLQEMAK
jgi:hypothetical protein